MELLVSIETSYGTRRVYPKCSKSRTLAEIAGTTTLTDRDVNLIKQLGYTFRVVTEEV
jgi:hypothetical protein